MDSNGGSIHLLIQKLDNLLRKLDNYKPLLQQNVLSAEFDIRANFSSLMELLSNRQKNLIMQLHNIATEKGLLIESHKETIESLRSVLLSCTSKIDTDSKVNDYIRKAEAIVLTPSLTPFVTFKAESGCISNVVSNYGRLAPQYPGHFADPSRPSIVLPCALEEEDDHAERFSESVSHSKKHCSCVDPKLEKWLALPKHCCELEKLKCDKDISFKNDSVCDSEDISLKDKFYEFVDQVKRTHGNCLRSCSSSRSSVRVPCYQPDSAIVRTWLELRDQRKCNDYESTHASDFISIKNADTLISDSFDVLTGSSISSSRLKDWLYYDSIELTDMPGLSALNPQQTTALNMEKKKNTDISPLSDTTKNANNNRGKTTNWLQDISLWLAPSNDVFTLPTKVARLSLENNEEIKQVASFSSYFDATGTRHLSYWLSPDNIDQANNNIERDNTLTDATLEQQPIDNFNDVSELESDDTDPMPHRVNADDQFCPLYGQCLGGPGGPTCCSTNRIMTTEVQPVVEQKSKSHPIVDQLNAISSSDLKMWIVGGGGGGNMNKSDEVLSKEKDVQPESVDKKWSIDRKWLITSESDVQMAKDCCVPLSECEDMRDENCCRKACYCRD